MKVSLNPLKIHFNLVPLLNLHNALASLFGIDEFFKMLDIGKYQVACSRVDEKFINLVMSHT
jgi:hypothetical protein